MQNTTVIYHYGCPDGLAGLWCFKKLIESSDTNKAYKGKFNDVIEEVKGRTLIFVDFTYRVDVMRELLQHAERIVVLDHHKTALDLVDLVKEYNNHKFQLVLDMEHSGAQIAWDYVRGTYDSSMHMKFSETFTTNRPWFIDDIADRDTWKWQVPDSKFTTKAMNALQFYTSLEAFDKLTEESRAHIIDVGKILDKVESDTINQICKNAVKCYCTSPLDATKTWKVMLIQTTHNLASEVGAALCEKNQDVDFAVMYRYDILSDEWWLSCRASKESKTDLTEVAKYFSKGGGHAKAAGLTLYNAKGQFLRSVFAPMPHDEDLTSVLQQPGSAIDEPSQLK
jgi:oligoribonuclease NrnB/cAMP/cGMP phosphodiesterase (DHH superfamily)